MITAIIGSLILRFAEPAMRLVAEHSEIGMDLLLPGNLTMLGSGGLLALAHSRNHTLLAYLPFAGLLAFVAMMFLLLAGYGHAQIILPFEALAGSALIHACASGITGIGKVLEWTPLRYCGKISYGLYLFHPLVMGVLAGGALSLRLSLGFELLAATTVLTIMLASLSWYALELPFNHAKRYFSYPAGLV